MAGRPIHCQVPGIEYTVGNRAVQTMLEGATAIALSYSGTLYIAETDEKKVHRIRQVTTSSPSPAVPTFQEHFYKLVRATLALKMMMGRPFFVTR